LAKRTGIAESNLQILNSLTLDFERVLACRC